MSSSTFLNQIQEPIVPFNPKNPYPYFEKYGYNSLDRAGHMIENNRIILSFKNNPNLKQIQSQRINNKFYSTSLNSCNCTDFIKNNNQAKSQNQQYKCKHIYYLEMKS